MKIKQFNNYLAGLFEGDGHIWIQNFIKKKKHNPRFCITFHIKDIELALFIKNFIGYGFIRKKIKENAIVLVISNEIGLKKIIELIYNNFYTPKIIQLKNLINWLNLNKNFNNFKLIEVNKNEILFNNSWFAGFVEADGNFYIRISTIKKRYRVSFRFAIDQRKNDPITNEDYKDILSKISVNFNIKLSIINREYGSYYRLETTKKDSLLKIIKYFDEFQMYGVKNLNFLDWKKAFYIYHDGKKLDNEKIDKLKSIKLLMNKNRKNFELYWFK